MILRPQGSTPTDTHVPYTPLFRSYPIDIDEVPKRLKQAFLATEDARFYEHHGVDYTGVARAIWLIFKTGSKEGVPGGSTITQQVARQFFLSSEVTYTRSEEHTSELQSLIRISYAVFCLTKKN